MLGTTLRRAAAAAAASLAVAFVSLPAPAHAVTEAPPIGPSTVVATATPTATPNPNDGLDAAFGGQPTTLLQSILCPVVTAVTGATSNIPGVGPLLDQLPGIVCAISVLGYVYRTTYYPPSGPPIVKYTKALIGVPTLIDVDGKGLPDFTGVIGIALPGLSLQLSRSLLFSASEKVTIEAVAIVPGATNTYVGFGEDGSKVGTAKHWKAALTIAGFSSEGAELKLAIDTLNAPTSLGVLGEMFSGPDPDAPDDTFRGVANFSPVPDNFTARIVAAKAQQEVHVASTPSTLTADVDILNGNRAQNVHAVADQLPSTIDVVHSTVSGNDSTTYDANAAIAKITGTYHDTVDGNIKTAAALDAWGIPKHLSFVQAGSRTTVDAGSGKIDRIQARFATDSEVDPLDPGTAPFAKLHRFTSTHLTAGLQVSDFKSVSIDQGPPLSGRLVFATAPGLFPFTLDDDVTSTKVKGHLSNLPADTEVTADVDNGHVTFNGHGTGIHEIAINATRPTPFFTEAKRVDLTVTDLPALVNVDFKPDGSSLKFTPSQPIGSVSLLASDGSDAPAASGDYASYEDTPSRYRLFLQMLSVGEITVATAPVLKATLNTGNRQTMTLFAHLADDALTQDLKVDGTIDKLPTQITVTADLDNGHLNYTGQQTIDDIHVTATDTIGTFFNRANKLDLDIGGLPASNTIDFKPDFSTVKFTPSSPIGSVSLLASNGAGAPATNDTDDYASYEDTPSLYRIFLKVRGISGLEFAADPISGTVKTDQPRLMHLLAHLQTASSNTTVTGTIDKLPSWIDFSTQLADNLTVVEYDSHGQKIDHITLDGTGLVNPTDNSPLPLGIDTLHAEIDSVPSYLKAVLNTASGTDFSFVTDNSPPGDDTDRIGRILVQAYPSGTGAHNSVAGHQTAYGNLQTGQFTADIHGVGRTFFDVDGNSQNLHYTIASDPLDYEFVMDNGKFLKGRISNPTPATININNSGKVDVHYRATTDTQIDSITLKTNLAPGYIDADLQNIAPDVKICFDGGGSKPCKPGFVPQSSFDDGDGVHHNMPSALFDFMLTPTALNGSAWPQRFELDGTYCFSESDPGTCLNSGAKKERVALNNLKFGKMAVGAGYTEDGCTACTAGRVYGYFDTDNTLISGDVKYFKDGDDGAFVHYHSDGDDGGIQAQNKFLFVDFCIVCLNDTNVYTVSGGSFSCVSEPHLDIDIPVFDDIDILSGSFISFC